MKCKSATNTLQQKIEITDLKPFLAGENTGVLIILATTVNLHPYHYIICNINNVRMSCKYI